MTYEVIAEVGTMAALVIGVTNNNKSNQHQIKNTMIAIIATVASIVFCVTLALMLADAYSTQSAND